jgi:hypothetical protein
MRLDQFNFSAPWRAALRAPGTVRHFDAPTFEQARAALAGMLNAINNAEPTTREQRDRLRPIRVAVHQWEDGPNAWALADFAIADGDQTLRAELIARDPLPEHRAQAIAELAMMFRAEVRNVIAPCDLAMVDRINNDPNPDAMIDGACATHNYTDTNQCMLNAFAAVWGREIYFAMQSDADAINAAWNAAKAFGFSDNGGM